MNPEKLRKQFKSETGTNWTNQQGEPDIDYVMWLEAKLIPITEQGEGKTPEEILIETYGCKDLQDLRTCFITSDTALSMIYATMREYADTALIEYIKAQQGNQTQYNSDN